MFEQSGRRRALSGAFLACVVLALPATAQAQEQTMPVPADAPTALTAPDGSALIVFVAGTRLCFAVHAAGDERPVDVPRRGVQSGGDEPDGGCRTVPVFAPPAGEELVDFSSEATSGHFMVTGTAVAAVQGKRDGKVVAHSATVASPLPGMAADLRFAFLPTPKPGVEADAIDEIALLDATGAVRRARQPLFFDDERPVGQTLSRGRKGRRAWRLSSYRKQVLSPTPLLPERKVTVTCLSVNVGDSTDGVCDDERFATVPSLSAISASCSSPGITIAVLVRSHVRRVTLVLGDGSRHPVPLHRVPGDPDGLAAGIALVGPDTAIRRMDVIGAGGDVLLSEALQRAPASSSDSALGCGGYSSWVLSYEDPALRAPGPHAFQAADQGIELCLATGRAPNARDDCAIPPIDVDGSRLLHVPREDGTTVAGLVSADVAVMRLTLDDGSRHDIPATPIPGYAGQYASTTLLINAEVPAPRRVGGYQLLDARGRVLADFDDGVMPAVKHRATVLRTPGLPPLRAALVTGIGNTALPCLGFGALDAVSDCTSGGFGSFAVRAHCDPRRIVIWGLLAHAADDLIVQTADGREITARKAVLPAAIRQGKGTTAALLVLPARVSVRRLLLRGRAGGKTGLALPPAAEQCGYQASAQIGSLRD